MTVRNDVIIEWETSPRLVTVLAPSVEINVQDLHDTTAAFQDSLTGGQHSNLRTTAGKEDLGGGTFVGLTMTLLNTQVAFEKRTIVLQTGTVTTADVNGMTLTDIAASFLTNGVKRGDLLVDKTDGSHCSVVRVDSETSLLTDGAGGGSDNQFDFADSYEIYDFVQCNLSGGNVVALDDVGSEIEPIFPTFGTQVIRVSSSSATLQGSTDIANIKYLIESTRPHHTGTGSIWYWNPDGGNDAGSGLSADDAFETFAAAHNAAGDGTHDVIVALSGVSGQTTTEETIEITKNYLFLRGPGRDFRFKPTATTAPTISINAVGIEVSGVVVDTAASGGQSAIEVQDGADFFFIDHCWSRDAQHACVKVLGSTVYGRVDGCFFSHPVDSGIHVDGNTRHLRITNTEIDSPGAEGVHLGGTTVRNNIIGSGVKIYNSAGYGLRIDAPGTRNHIDGNVSLYDNALGDILDNGTLTDNELLARDDLTFLRNVAEADEEYNSTQAIKRIKGTGTVLVQKDRAGGTAPVPPITLVEP